MDFADAVETMMDARDAFKSDPSEENEQAYQAAKMVVSDMFDKVASSARSYDDAKKWGGY